MREFPAVSRNDTRLGKKAEGACNSELIDRTGHTHQKRILKLNPVRYYVGKTVP
jgi:hypothetical protein